MDPPTGYSTKETLSIQVSMNSLRMMNDEPVHVQGIDKITFIEETRGIEHLIV
jgi:hypothetical protein